MDKIQEIKTIIKSGVLPYINTTSTECINLIYDLIKNDKTYILSPEQLFEAIYNIYIYINHRKPMSI